MGGKGKQVAEAFMREAKRLLDKIPFEKLPDAIRDAFKSLKQKVDEFFSKMEKANKHKENFRRGIF